MATKVEEAGYEIDDLLKQFAPQLEGLKDLAMLNMSPLAKEEVTQSIKRYERRVKLLGETKDKLAAVLADGHPNMPPTAIDPAALTSIRENAETVRIASATFISNALPEGQASQLNMAAGPVEKK